ncbi:MAG: hypothetical protein M1825_002680 [Sarcosagium campestre]|nr:MAG: hypothetical protein M1825_002680 [Sarcosagium campestre]
MKYSLVTLALVLSAAALPRSVLLPRADDDVAPFAMSQADIDAAKAAASSSAAAPAAAPTAPSPPASAAPPAAPPASSPAANAPSSPAAASAAAPTSTAAAVAASSPDAASAAASAAATPASPVVVSPVSPVSPAAAGSASPDPYDYLDNDTPYGVPGGYDYEDANGGVDRSNEYDPYGDYVGASGAEGTEAPSDYSAPPADSYGAEDYSGDLTDNVPYTSEDPSVMPSEMDPYAEADPYAATESGAYADEPYTGYDGGDYVDPTDAPQQYPSSLNAGSEQADLYPADYEGASEAPTYDTPYQGSPDAAVQPDSRYAQEVY